MTTMEKELENLLRIIENSRTMECLTDKDLRDGIHGLRVVRKFIEGLGEYTRLFANNLREELSTLENYAYARAIKVD